MQSFRRGGRLEERKLPKVAFCFPLYGVALFHTEAQGFDQILLAILPSKIELMGVVIHHDAILLLNAWQQALVNGLELLLVTAYQHRLIYTINNWF